MSHFLVEGVDHLLKLHHRHLTVAGMVQDEQQAAYYSQPGARDVCICWKTMSAAAICHLVKACNPWNNGAIAAYNGFEVRIIDAEPAPPDGNLHSPPGTILATSNSFLVSCINNEALHLHTLMVNGVLMPGRFAANYGFIKGQSFNNF
jgi:methionyl-tRNA formyltransferase